MEPENQRLTPAASGVPLYSAQAVRGFSILFSTIAGGALMAQNLREVGQPGAARTALWSSIGYTVGVLWLTSFLPDRVSGVWLPLLVGYAGALGLEAYFKKFVENRNGHPAKNIRKPLLICLAITLPLMALVVYSLIVAGPPDGGQ